MFSKIAFNRLLFQYIFFLSTSENNKNIANAYTYYERYNKKQNVYCA